MAGKYEKNIITDFRPEPDRPKFYGNEDRKKNMDDAVTRMIRLDEDVINGSSFVTSSWYWPQSTPTEFVGESHTHPFDEVVAFFGTDADNPNDLCGEIEFWLGGEQYILTKSCIIFAPKEVEHCPLIVRRVGKPIFHFATGPGKYS
ncbi:hypothetical protein ACFL6W_01630 [Thermodesulfobacteriota bacterium]